MSDMHNAKNFVSRSHDGGKIASIFKGLSRSSSRSTLRGSQKKLPTLLQVIRRQRKMKKELDITLPSDKQWRLKNYFKLLERQRIKKLAPDVMPSVDTDEESDSAWDPALLAPDAKRPRISCSPSQSAVASEGSIPTSQVSDIVWTSLDIAKAAALLITGRASVTFRDEDEMRRVFTLLYDIFRYKIILARALQKTGFSERYPYAKAAETEGLVWLLFFDLHKRRFLPREHADAAMCRDAFKKLGLLPIEEDLWGSRVKLAAALARHRIKNNALRLNQLLPQHLRDEKLISIEETPVTGWVNTFRTSKKLICDSIESLGLKLQSKHETILTKSDFRFDHLCPKLLLCHPQQRTDLAQSSVVKQYSVVLQDRAFCLGPTMTAKVLADLSLRGTVAQSHVNSPRATAYLANILQDNDKIDKIIAFGASDRLLEYQTYLHDLGVTNCEVYAQKFSEVHPEAAILENLVMVLVTPPNSYTGVTDPVDLICSRGGDMNMLKALTQTEMNEDVMGFLAEQRDTLKYCMSLPQVQIIMYETHSVADEENLGMVNRVIQTMNKWATDKHLEEHRMQQEQEEAEEKNKPMTPATPAQREQREREAQEALEAQLLIKNIEVPPCDLFELASLPELCMHGTECMADDGCFIARIQRKEIISLDAKYMIKIAEARGLFGLDQGQKKSSTARAQKKREDLAAQRSTTGSPKSRGRKLKTVEIDRITAPTMASLNRMRRDSRSSLSEPPCPRHQHHAEETHNKVVIGISAAEAIQQLKVSRSTLRKIQQESTQRLSLPFKRPLSSSPDTDFGSVSDIKPNFWRFASAKSIEDLLMIVRQCPVKEIQKSWANHDDLKQTDFVTSGLAERFIDVIPPTSPVSQQRTEKKFKKVGVQKSVGTVSKKSFGRRIKMPQSKLQEYEEQGNIAMMRREPRGNLVLPKRYFAPYEETDHTFMDELKMKLSKHQKILPNTLTKRKEKKLVERLSKK